MSKSPELEKEMMEWEKKKYQELLKEIEQQLQMIENFTKQIAVVLQRYRDNYYLEFGCDVQDVIYNRVFEAL
jgi:hypothetical protein